MVVRRTLVLLLVQQLAKRRLLIGTALQQKRHAAGDLGIRHRAAVEHWAGHGMDVSAERYAACSSTTCVMRAGTRGVCLSLLWLPLARPVFVRARCTTAARVLARKQQESRLELDRNPLIFMNPPMS